jgi:hypothetical protein
MGVFVSDSFGDEVVNLDRKDHGGHHGLDAGQSDADLASKSETEHKEIV